MQEIPKPLEMLAKILEIRKQHSRPYNLLLTSSISLTPVVLKKICGSENWQDFREYLQALGPNDRLDMLSYHLGLNNQDGYDVVARLVKAGYFSTILTTNLDSTLENALSKYGLQPPAYRLLIVDLEMDEYISKAFETLSRDIYIIKLHGSLKERVLPATYPDFFERRESTRKVLERCLNQDILIVGVVDKEDDIVQALVKESESSIYYAHPYSFSYDSVVKTIIARHNKPEAFVIYEPFGDFVTFFAKLEALLPIKPETEPLPRPVPPSPVEPVNITAARSGSSFSIEIPKEYIMSPNTSEQPDIPQAGEQGVGSKQLQCEEWLSVPSQGDTSLDKRQEEHIESPPALANKILVLPTRQSEDVILEINMHYNDLIVLQSSIVSICKLFDGTRKIQDDQYERIIGFFQRVKEAVDELLDEIEYLPTDIKPRRFPFRKVLHSINASVRELQPLTADRASLHPEISRALVSLSQHLDDVKGAFYELGIRDKS